VVIDDGKAFVVVNGATQARKGQHCACTPAAWFEGSTCDVTSTTKLQQNCNL
jgi:uncharacterized Zn-binding protein involved in type VI secretion